MLVFKDLNTLWIEFIEHRNNTSHAYDEEVAKTVFHATEEFFIEVQKLIIKLELLK